MIKVMLFSAIVFSCVFCVTGQNPVLVSTSTLDGARFEVIQSPISREITFRLDKWSGNIDRLGTCPKDDGYGSKQCWKEMTVLELSKAAPSPRPHYQIIINPTLQITMLMQIDTGRSWQFGLDPQERWFPFIECTDKTNNSCLWRP